MPDLSAIVRTAGGTLTGPASALLPGPGHSRSDRSLSVAVIGDRVVWHSFAGDPFAVCAAHLSALGLPIVGARQMTKLERREAERARKAAAAAHAADRERRRAVASELWDKSSYIAGTIAERYLRCARAIGLPLHAAELRFMARAPLFPLAERSRTAPALIAAVRNAAGELLAAHLTFLQPDGSGKAGIETPRKVVGPKAGGAIRLGATSARAVVAEGIESALSAAEALADRGLIATPFAAVDAAGVAAFVPGAEIRELIVAPDRGDAGERAGAALERRALAAGLRVRRLPPPAGLSDWNDAAIKGAQNAR